jgi:hypothetical protein
VELPVIEPPGDVVLPMNALTKLYYSEGNVDAMPPNNGASLLLNVGFNMFTIQRGLLQAYANVQHTKQ